jgi:hypothetical protein
MSSQCEDGQMKEHDGSSWPPKMSQLDDIIGWIALSIAPRLCFDDDGFLWFIINMPVSDFVEERWGLGSRTPGLIILVTFVNATIVASVGLCIATVIDYRNRRRRGMEVIQNELQDSHQRGEQELSNEHTLSSPITRPQGKRKR